MVTPPTALAPPVIEVPPVEVSWRAVDVPPKLAVLPTPPAPPGDDPPPVPEVFVEDVPPVPVEPVVDCDVPPVATPVSTALDPAAEVLPPLLGFPPVAFPASASILLIVAEYDEQPVVNAIIAKKLLDEMRLASINPSE